MSKIVKMIAEAAKKDVSQLGYYVVYARAGRFDGTAAVRASSKSEAKKIAQNNGWLETGRVYGCQTAEQYIENGMADSAEDFLDIVKLSNHEKELQHGEWVELEWGT